MSWHWAEGERRRGPDEVRELQAGTSEAEGAFTNDSRAGFDSCSQKSVQGVVKLEWRQLGVDRCQA